MSGKKGHAGRKLFDGKNYDAVILKLMQAWSVGGSDHEAAAHAEISTASLCQFLKSHPDISEQKDQLKEKPVLSARSSLHKAIAAGDGALALKYLERKRKQEFSTLQEVKSDVHLEAVDPETETLKNDIAGINAAIAREIAEIEKIQKAINHKCGKS